MDKNNNITRWNDDQILLNDAKLPDQNEAKKEKLDGKNAFSPEDFEALVDAFRTLLEWSKEMEEAKNKK
ncbi:MAG TPA: hypothetical protein DDW49_02515 [Deltaproteobacteria bacterium]|nr:hypothetical protein [Deltaproteobacteria bacterium]